MTTVVIGAGLAGLNAALTLQEAGEDVELFEASDNVGGRARSDYTDGFILDRGFQLINRGYSEIVRLGLSHEIDFVKFPRDIDVVTPLGISTIGDPRTSPVSALLSPLGSLKEKIAFLRFLASPSRSGESLESEALRKGAGDLYLNVLQPFLRGVFLADPDSIDASYGKEMIRTFLKGDSGLPTAGVGVLAEAIAARVERIHLNASVETLDQFKGKNIVVATDEATANRLTGRNSTERYVDSFTWYHWVEEGSIESPNLRITSANSPIVNSIALSRSISQYAPEGKVLLATTTLTDLAEVEVKSELSKFWQVSEFNFIKKYSIKNSLPLVAPGSNPMVASTRIAEGLYIAGDYLTSGSQNGALLSGRLAAIELLDQLTR